MVGVAMRTRQAKAVEQRLVVRVEAILKPGARALYPDEHGTAMTLEQLGTGKLAVWDLVSKLMMWSVLVFDARMALVSICMLHDNSF